MSLMFLTLATIALGVTFTSAKNSPSNLKLEALSADEKESVRGSFLGQACDDPDPCPSSTTVSCSGVSCSPDPLDPLGHCTGGYSGCTSSSGNYMTCSWAWCWYCDSDGGGGACGPRMHANCFADGFGGCYCSVVSAGSCKHNCS